MQQKWAHFSQLCIVSMRTVYSKRKRDFNKTSEREIFFTIRDYLNKVSYSQTSKAPLHTVLDFTFSSFGKEMCFIDGSSNSVVKNIRQHSFHSLTFHQLIVLLFHTEFVNHS